jgi:hypothetical protein
MLLVFFSLCFQPLLLKLCFVNYPSPTQTNNNYLQLYAHDNLPMAPFPLACKVVMSGHGQDSSNTLSDDSMNNFKPKQHNIINEAFLQVDFKTHGIQSPRPFQI